MLNADDLVKLRKSGMDHPGAVGAHICARCLGAVMPSGYDCDGEAVHDTLCGGCTVDLAFRKRDAIINTAREMAEHRWVGLSCVSCRRLTHLAGCQYCVECLPMVYQAFSQTPSRELFERNRDIAPVNYDEFISSEISRIKKGEVHADAKKI